MQHSIEDKITVSLRRKFVARQGVMTSPIKVYKVVHRLRLRRIQHSIGDKISGRGSLRQNNRQFAQEVCRKTRRDDESD